MTQTNEPQLISDGLRYWVDQEFPGDSVSSS